MCTRLLAIALLILGGVLSLASAHRAAADGKILIKRATFDLKCPQGQLHWTKIDDRTYGVTGCGKRATYVETCDGPRKSTQTTCTWVMNTKSKR